MIPLNLLVIPFLAWLFCFRHFFTGHLSLEADAVSYADHIRFYADSLSKGVFPLWDPTWFGGVPNNFFLRRFGEANPFLFLIVLLKGLGVPSATAYLVFLAVYYFLAGWAVYLIANLLFEERFYAYTAYILFLFSSWGCEVFYNYIVIIFVPIIWFFYFLLSFFRTPQRKYFLGACFCVGLILTTYIPFFFLTIFTIFVLLYALFYVKSLLGLWERLSGFIRQNRVSTVFCIVFLLISCLPALLFYHESKSGEFVLPDRHSGAQDASAVAVSLDLAAGGDLISHGYFDRLFDDQEHMGMGDIYVPYLFFLLLFCATLARVNKLIFFLLFNILALSLIAVASVGGVYRFLYDHIMVFRFIRQTYYFFWLAMLPMAILLTVSAFRSLLAAIDASSQKRLWLIYIIGCHLLFILFMFTREGVLWGAWLAVFISLSYFLVYFYADKKISYRFGFYALLLAVFFQSAQVYTWVNRELFKLQQSVSHPEQMLQSPPKIRMSPYYSMYWFSVLINYIDPQVLGDYLTHKFIFYDNVAPYMESPAFFKTLQSIFQTHANCAFILLTESTPALLNNKHEGSVQADIDPVSSGELEVLHSDVNTIILRAHLPKRRFLVINDNYHPDWHAFINGQPARLFRANVSFKGLWVPAGDTEILLHFSTFPRYLFHYALMLLFMGTFIYFFVLYKNLG